MSHLPSTPSPTSPSGPLTPNHVDPALGFMADTPDALYRSIVALASDAIVVTDAQQRIVLFNRGAEGTFGYPAADVIGQPLGMLLPARVIARHERQFVPAFAMGDVPARDMAERGEVHGRRKSGEEFPAEVAISRGVVDGELRLCAIVRDVSLRRRQDEALRASEMRYRTLIEAAHDGIFVCDPNTRVTLANPAFAAICGRTVAELLGMPVADLIAPEDLAMTPLRTAELATARRLETERTLLRPDGTRVRAEIGVSRLADGQIQCIVHDITERRRLEERIWASERRFRGIFDSAFQFVKLIAPNGTLIEANRRSLDFGGVTAEDVVGRPIWQIPWWHQTPDVTDRLRDAVARAAAGAFVRFEVEHLGANGEVLIVDFSLNPVRDASGAVTLLVAEGRDVTAWRATARRLQESEASFRNAFEHSGIGMGLVGLDGRWERVNHAMCAIVGYSAAELHERTFRDITHPEDLALDDALVAQLVDGTRDSYELEKRYIRKDGQVVWILLNASIVRDAERAPRFFIAQVQDVTARKQTELELRQQRADLARSNAELEQFAYVASHDLQEPLRAVASYTQLLGERYAPELDDRARRYIAHAVQGAQRMQSLIGDLLTLSRLGTQRQPPVVVDLDDVLNDTLAALHMTIIETGTTITRDPLPAIRGEPAQLRQLFQNLLANALKFRRPGIAPHVRISAASTDGEWTLAVHDDGIGIDPLFADRIFEIFQRLHTRDEYPGTGIGLAICRKVVERHGGRIWVEPAPGGGSVFGFTLPGTSGHDSLEHAG